MDLMVMLPSSHTHSKSDVTVKSYCDLSWT